MKTISLDGAQQTSINLYRMALSEESQEQRLRAIEVVTHDVVARQVALFTSDKGKGWMSEPRYSEFSQLVMRSADERYESAMEFGQILRRYEEENDRSLYVAELVGMHVLISIKEGSLHGIHASGGIFDQVRLHARENEIPGARTKAALLKCWRTYRGVVHLGVAMRLCGANPEQGHEVLTVAEGIRQELSSRGPGNRSDPYVDQKEQISFVAKTIA